MLLDIGRVPKKHKKNGSNHTKDFHPPIQLPLPDQCLNSTSTLSQLSCLNQLVEQAWEQRASNSTTQHSPASIDPNFLSESYWDQWLWHEDPLEEAPVDTMLNRMQLLGLLIARHVDYRSIKHD